MRGWEEERSLKAQGLEVATNTPTDGQVLEEVMDRKDYHHEDSLTRTKNPMMRVVTLVLWVAQPMVEGTKLLLVSSPFQPVI